MRISAVICAAAGGSLFAASSAPAANDQRLAVIPVVIGHPETASTIAGAAAEATELRENLALVSLDDYDVREGGEAWRRIVACGQESACIAKELRTIDVELGLAVILNGEIDPPVLALVLVRARDSHVAAERYDQLARSKPIRVELLERMNELFDELGYARMAKLVVNVRPSRAVLELDGAPRNAGPLVVKPGEHALVARLEDHVPVERRVRVAPGETAVLELELEPEASGASPWLWGGIGIAAVLAGAAIVAVLVSSSTERTACLVTPSMPCSDADR